MKVAITVLVLCLVEAISSSPVEEKKIGGDPLNCVIKAIDGLKKCLSGEKYVAENIAIGQVQVKAFNQGGDIVECLKAVAKDLVTCLVSGDKDAMGKF